MEAVGGSSDDDEEEAEMQPRIRERAPSISSVFMVMLLSWGPAWREEGRRRGGPSWARRPPPIGHHTVAIFGDAMYV